MMKIKGNYKVTRPYIAMVHGKCLNGWTKRAMVRHWYRVRKFSDMTFNKISANISLMIVAIIALLCRAIFKKHGRMSGVGAGVSLPAGLPWHGTLESASVNDGCL